MNLTATHTEKKLYTPLMNDATASADKVSARTSKIIIIIIIIRAIVGA